MSSAHMDRTVQTRMPVSFHIQQGQISVAGTVSGPTGVFWKENELSFPYRISADVPLEKRQHRTKKLPQMDSRPMNRAVAAALLEKRGETQ